MLLIGIQNHKADFNVTYHGICAEVMVQQFRDNYHILAGWLTEPVPKQNP